MFCSETKVQFKYHAAVFLGLNSQKSKVATISMLVTRLLSSSHAPQWRGRAWIASTNTFTASFSRSSFRSTTPYLCFHISTQFMSSYSSALSEEKTVHIWNKILTGTGWIRPTLLHCASYWAQPWVLAKLHFAPDPSPEDLQQHRKKRNRVQW